MKKKIISLLTTLVMVVTMVCTAFSVDAANTAEANQVSDSAIDNDMNIKGSNDFGTMLADTFSEEQSEQEANNGYNVFSVEIIDTTAVVEFETLQDCTLLVGIYDEAGEAMLASGSLEVYTGETDAYVDIETESMPEYFYLRAFLIDTYSLRPLCTSYESPNYTQEMQEFFAKTVDDFDNDRVLNLDESKDNNFAVYGENTTVVKQTSRKNEVVSANEENNIYVIKNADSSITSLKSGDVFSYEYTSGEVLIVKVKTISVSGTTVTITGQDAEMDDAFEYVKIDAEAGTADAEIDASNLEDGITYNGLVESPEDGIQSYAIDVGGSVELLAYEYEITDKKIGSAKVSGSIQLKTTASAKVYVSWSYQYIELKLDYFANVSFSLSGKGNGSMPLAYMCFLPIPGLIIGITPSVVLETNVTAEISGTLKGTVGFKASNTEGLVDLTKSPTFTTEFKIEGTVFVGLSLEPKVKIISDYLAKATLSAKAGVEIKGTLTKSSEDNSDANKIHECNACIDGDITAKLTISFEAKLLNWDSLTFKLNLVDLSIDICDFYFSYDFAEFDFTSCPHLKYKATITVYDSNFDSVSGATVKIDGKEYKTDENGKVMVYLNNGSYTVNASKTGVGSVQSQVTVSDNAVKKSITLSNSSSSGNTGGNTGNIGGSTGDNTVLKIKYVSLGAYHSAVITEDGSLYTWGYNSSGQLGNGTTTISSTPIKIMDNVKSVSLGDYHSAVITEDGSLYTWGYNGWGELGNGTYNISTTPIKIMDNVKSVSLGGSHSAAITNDGSLYTWGHNGWGELGNGTTEGSYTPIKIMDNVKSVSLGGSHSAAITNDGSLYTWGYNNYGQLGNGTPINSHTPIKIMDNVKSVSLGSDHSAAITEDGSLYLWGYNVLGEVGDGTANNYRYTPIKIMDNVKSVSLGGAHSAAITEDGSLYIWGWNGYGMLGNGTTTTSYICLPIKIMDNVKSVSLGGAHSAAITEDGSLYTWGDNSSGQLGNGTTTDSSTPIKITIPAETSAISTLSLEPMALSLRAAGNTKAFTGLKKNEIYNIYALKSEGAENTLGAENLLYITQGVTDNSGKLSISYDLTESCDDPTWLAVPMHGIDISGASVTVSNLNYSGKEQYVEPVVKLGTKTLTEGIDYYLEKDYSAIEPGEYTVIVTGMGEYSGSVEVMYSVEDAYLLGDINNDGKITTADVGLANAHAKGTRLLNDEQFKRGEMNNDGKITTADVGLINAYAKGTKKYS